MVKLRLALALAVGLGAISTHSQPAQSAVPQPQAASAASKLTPDELGDVYMARKMYREAIEAYGEGSKKNPVLVNKTGIAYHQLGQLDKAKKYYEQAIKLNPKYSEAHNNLGTVYYATKSLRRAVSAYKKALRISPNSPSYHMNLGMAYFQRKMEKEAMAEYRIALQLDPDVFEKRGTFGVVLEERSVEEKAKYHYAMAKLYAQGNRTDLAIQYLRKALEEGFKDKKKLEKDPEFQAMRRSPEFKELLALEPRVL